MVENGIAFKIVEQAVRPRSGVDLPWWALCAIPVREFRRWHFGLSRRPAGSGPAPSR
jgi:hypothetical protein